MNNNTTICEKLLIQDNSQGRVCQNDGKLPSETLCSALADLNKHDLWYLVGYTYADGCVVNKNCHYYLKWKSKDKAIIEYIKDMLKSNCKIQIVDDKYYSLVIGSKSLVLDFMSLGIIPNKTYMNVFPTINIAYFNDFTRGYFDGDGCVSLATDKKGIKYIQVQFVNKLKENLQHFGDILKQELGVIPLIHSHEESYRLNYSTHAAVSLYWYMYKDNDSFCLERKKNIFLQWLSERNQPKYGRRACEVCGNEYSVLHDKSRVCYKCKMKVKSDLIGNNKITQVDLGCS